MTQITANLMEKTLQLFRGNSLANKWFNKETLWPLRSLENFFPQITKYLHFNNLKAIQHYLGKFIRTTLTIQSHKIGINVRCYPLYCYSTSFAQFWSINYNSKKNLKIFGGKFLQEKIFLERRKSAVQFFCCQCYLKH